MLKHNPDSLMAIGTGDVAPPKRAARGVEESHSVLSSTAQEASLQEGLSSRPSGRCALLQL